LPCIPTSTGLKAIEAGNTVKLTVDCVPVPERISFCGLLNALSVTVTLAVRLPVAVGLKVTVMPQLAPAAKVLPQVLVWAKSPGLAPPMAMLVMFKVVLARLVMVAVCGALVVPMDCEAKVKLAGANLTAVPLPLRAAVCVPPPSTTLSVADCVPSAFGLNVTEMVQLAPAPRDEPQVLLLMENSEAFVPVIVMLEMAKVELPELVRVATLGWLVEPMGTIPQLKVVGERVALSGPYTSSSVCVPT